MMSFDELEETLIMADVGVIATDRGKTQGNGKAKGTQRSRRA